MGAPGLVAAFRAHPLLRAARRMLGGAGRRAGAGTIRLTEHDARLLGDLGLEPGDVEDAMNGRFSALVLDPLRVSRPEE